MRAITLAFLLVSFSHVVNAQKTFTYQTRPDIHGDSVVFSAESDLWLGNIKTGDAKRLTTDQGLETTPRFSPDGSQIAFVGQYDGPREIYVIPARGGVPTRLTFGTLKNSVSVEGWTQDGKSVLFRDDDASGLYFNKLRTVPVAGGIIETLPIPRGEFASIAPDGQIAYVPMSSEWMNWFKYKAGSADDIWLFNPISKSFKQVTKWEGVDTTPVWAAGLIFYISEKSGSLNLWSIDPKSGKDTQISNYVGETVRYPGSDGRQVVFQVGAGLARYDTVTGKIIEVKFEMNSDHIHERTTRVPIADSVSGAGIGPTGKRVVIESRGQILSVPVEEGDVRVLAKAPGARCQYPAWSPDGKKIAYVSDQSGENEIWTMDAATGQNAKMITKGLASNPMVLKWSPNGKLIVLGDRRGQTILVDVEKGMTTLVDTSESHISYDDTPGRMAFSPDSRLLCYQRGDVNFINAIRIYEIETKNNVRISPEGIDSFGGSISADGKFVTFIGAASIVPTWSEINQQVGLDNVGTVFVTPLTADAVTPFIAKPAEEAIETPKPTGTPETAAAPLKLDYRLDAAGSKVFQAPIPVGRYVSVDWIPGRFVIQSKAIPIMGASGLPGSLSAYDIDSKTLIPLGPADAYDLSSDGKKILVTVGSKLGVVDALGGPKPFKALELDAVTVAVSPRDEWKQILEETWRLARDFFYDADMHGADWNAIHKKYQAKFEFVGSREDLTSLQAAMISELQCGHCYVSGPRSGGPRGVPFGYLGADFEAAPVGIKIKKLYPGDGFAGSPVSPLLQQGLGIKEGDYILSIAGQRVLANQDPQALLVGTPGQLISIVVNTKPSLEGSRTVQVKPLGTENQLRYLDWVKSRVDYVKKVAGPEFGYMHVPNMTERGYVAFAKAQQLVGDRDAVIYDFRSNGGGNLSSTLLSTIGQKRIFAFHGREGKTSFTREQFGPRGYVAALCDQDAFSDGELVIETWRKMGLGPIVGKRTGGGEVGSGGGYTMIDGGRLWIPAYGAFDPDTNQWIIEGVGAKPDYEVDQDPTAVMAGKDPQLDKAIELLKAKLKKNPIKRSVPPPGKKLG